MRTEECLNGWWDFLPVTDPRRQQQHVPERIPTRGWQRAAMLVPGSWTRGGSTGEGKDGEPKPWETWRIFDNYGYPPEWDAMNTAWYRRTFDLPATVTACRWLLAFDGVLRTARVYVNGRDAGAITQGIMPAEFDVTALVQPGENTLVVFVTDFPRDDRDKILLPAGHDQTMVQKGIWQDVRLLSRPLLSIEDVTIRTSVRQHLLETLLCIRNDSATRRVVLPRLTLLDAGRVTAQWQAPSLVVPPYAQRTVTLRRQWRDYRPWSCFSPNLYQLETTLGEGDSILDRRLDRFGFREVWIEGPDLLLNGDPLHLFGDWCHKNSLENFRPEYIRQWYRMLKDCNMNYIRTHMFPHPPLALDLADEMGILVAVESAFAFGGSFALDKPAFWEAAREHVRAIVKRDKNHPSVILWSAGNEVRWSGNRPAIVAHYPGLIKLYETLDPTRIAYADGDSSLWDERTQPLRSRHYGSECSGERGWDQSQPLHVGEVGNWHFLQPTDACLWGDDRVFASADACHQAVAHECADLAGQARANGACAFFPWNLSGLDNLRPWPEERRHDWQEVDTPHIKPLRSPPYSSEFAWWDPDGPGYAPGPSFAIMRQAFRPLAIIIRERRRHFYDDQPIRHTVTLVNDTGGAIEGNLALTMEAEGRILWSHTQPLRLANGRRERLAFELPPIPVAAACARTIVCAFSDAGGTRESQSRPLRLTPRGERKRKWVTPSVAIYGTHAAIPALLRTHGIRPRRIKDLNAVTPRTTPLLIIAKEAVQAGSTANVALGRYLDAGGRALVLEQTCSIFPAAAIEVRPVEMAHPRGGAANLLAGFDGDDFAFWGNDPAGVTPSDAWVAFMAYRKPATGNFRTLIELGSGDFGRGGMHWTALMEVAQGPGLALACQLRLSDVADDHPLAARLLERMLHHLSQPRRGIPLRPLRAATPAAHALADRYAMVRTRKTDERKALELVDGDQPTTAAIRLLTSHARQGGTVVVQRLSAAGAARWSRVLGIELRLVDHGTQYCLLRGEPDPALDGVSHQDTFWIERLTYGAPKAVNVPIAHQLLVCPQAKPLLVSEYATCWREFFEQGAGTEWYRMPVATHLLGNGPRPHAAALLRLPCGKGTIYFCQVETPPAPHPKSERFWRQFMHNLGVCMAERLTDGAAVAAGSMNSEGFPREVILLADANPGMAASAVQAGEIRGEGRVPNQRITAAFDWTDLATPEGRVALPSSSAQVIIAFQLDPTRPRKAMPVEGGLPDPSQQTLLDLSGDGLVEVTVNGRRYEPVDLGDDGTATVADIDLEMQWNTAVILWQPQAGRTLQLKWRNRQGQPEREFQFTGRGW